MALTNRHGLPLSLVKAMEKSDAQYDAGDSDRTVSSLHEPPRVVLLKQKHKGEISADVSERITALLGTAFHKVMEDAAVDGDIVEKRFSTNVLGWKISGAVDKYTESTAHIADFKVISVWSIVVGDALAEYTKKLNTYAYLLRSNGKPVERLSIVVLYRDWSARDARKDRDYPQQQVQEIDLEVWPHDEAEAYVRAKTDIHQQAQILFDQHDELVECSLEDRWAKPEKWAVYSGNNTKATKLFDVEAEAKAFISQTTKPMRLEHRPGEQTRCMFFCPVRSVCPVGKSLEMQAEYSF